MGRPHSALDLAIRAGFARSWRLKPTIAIPEAAGTSCFWTVLSRPCRIHPIAASADVRRFGDDRHCGVRADAITFVRAGMACSKQARQANTAEKA